ncbi:Transcriptional regulatory protein sin3, partial [Rhizopus stolonifer]
ESDTEDTLDDQDTRSDKSQESQMNLFATAAAFTAPIFDDKNHTNAFLCNSNYYCLFRLFQVFYERLSKFKLLSDRIMANPDLGKKLNKTAIELDLVSNRFDDIDLSKGHYHASLDIIDRFLEGEYDQNTFEENLRYVCGIDAYVMFTVDKLLQSLIKQIQIVSMDKKSTDLLKQYIEKQRSNTAFSAYRNLIEDVLRSDENLYQIHFDKEIARIQLLDRAKTSQPGNESYDEYMSSYINWMQTTKGIHVSLLRPSFLNRNLCPENRHFERICVKSHLRYKIEQQSYHMYYIVGSEDVLYRASPVNYTHHDASWRQWLSNKGNDVLSFQTKKLLN